jgi:hypothetical protein
MSEEDAEWGYARMRVIAATMIAAVHLAQSSRPGLLGGVNLAVLERVVAGERVLAAEIDRAYTMIEFHLCAARAADTASQQWPE